MKTAWKPTSPSQFVIDYMQGMDDTELAKAHGATPDSVKKHLAKLRKHEGLPARKDLDKWEGGFELKHDRERRAFAEFLLRMRTRKQIEEKFGPALTEQFLDEAFDGLELYKQINDFGVPVFILLPKFNREIKVEPRDWKFHIPKTQHDEKVNQPYCLINLPDDAFSRKHDEKYGVGRIDIAPVFDVHYGHHAHKHSKFLSYIRWIQETPQLYGIIGGDLMENALDDGRGMSYEQEVPPTSQLDEIVHLLAPIAHKMLIALPGNHEWRTYNKSGIDPMKVVADRLGIPYFDGPVYLSVVAGEHRFKMYVQHGTGNSQTKGGKMNSAGRPRRWTDFVNFFVSGHVHDPVVNSETCICEDIANCCLRMKQQWTVIAPSFLNWEGSYAYRAGYAPPGSGGVVLQLFEDGSYRADMQ